MQQANGKVTLTRKCAGQCGATVNYSVVRSYSAEYREHEIYEPEIRIVGNHVAYAGGHLCAECAAIVEAALRHRLSGPTIKRRQGKQAGMRRDSGSL